MQGETGGPKTPEGKEAVSKNAIKHGIFSPNPVVIAGLETIEDWEEFEAEVIESWAPEGRYERELATDIAFGLWRLRRCRIHESAQISQQVEEVEAGLQQADADEEEYEEDEEDDTLDGVESPEVVPAEIEPVRLRAHQHLSVIPNGRSIERILRYETHVRRALLQTVQELEVRQAHRQGEKTPLARVAFSSGPGLHLPRPPASNTSAIRQLNRDINQKITGVERGLAAQKRTRSGLPEFLAKDEDE